MALADILQAIEAEATAEIGQIEAEALRMADQILSAAAEEARGIRERHLREIQAPLQQERARRLNQARVAALTAISQAREQVLAEALARARERLAGLRADASYPAVLRKLAEEARAQIGGECVLRADPRDQAHLRAMFPGAQLECDLPGWGGAAATTPDRRIAVINTLEARLEQAQPQLRQAVMQLLDDQPDDLWLTTTTPTRDYAR